MNRKAVAPRLRGTPGRIALGAVNSGDMIAELTSRGYTVFPTSRLRQSCRGWQIRASAQERAEFDRKKERDPLV